MKYSDCHVHFQGSEQTSRVLRSMDQCDIDVIGGLSPDPGNDPTQQREAVEWMAERLAEAPDRIKGFCWINPTLDGAVELTERAVVDLGYTGVKVIPNHWHAWDPIIAPFWAHVSQLHVPVIAHTGILWGYEDSSRFCRPVDFEVLIRYPGVRFAAAHIGWPWTDECIALAGRFAAESATACEISSQQHAPKPEGSDGDRMFIDVTLGAPRPYRADAISKALAVVGDERVMYGSDCSTPEDPASFRSHLDIDRVLLSGEIGASREAIGRIMHDNFLRFIDW